MKYYLIIAGSRKFNNFDYMVECLDDLLSLLVEEGVEIIVVSGTAYGADKLGEKYAELRGYDIIRMPANWEKEGKRAGYMRNYDMAKLVKEKGFGGCACFWDGDSPGTKWMIDICKKENIDCFIYQY